MKGRSTVPPLLTESSRSGERRTEAEQEYIPEQPVEREGSVDFIRGSRTSRSGRQAPISAEVLIDTY